MQIGKDAEKGGYIEEKEWQDPVVWTCPWDSPSSDISPRTMAFNSLKFKFEQA